MPQYVRFSTKSSDEITVFMNVEELRGLVSATFGTALTKNLSSYTDCYNVTRSLLVEWVVISWYQQIILQNASEGFISHRCSLIFLARISFINCLLLLDLTKNSISCFSLSASIGTGYTFSLTAVVSLKLKTMGAEWSVQFVVKHQLALRMSCSTFSMKQVFFWNNKA